MSKTRRMPDDLPQSKVTPEDEYERDLHPEPMGGQNVGAAQPTVAASDIKAVTRILEDFNMDELRQIRILSTGARLEQGAIYLDLNDGARRPFKAEGVVRARSDNILVPKAETPEVFWQRLVRK